MINPPPNNLTTNNNDMKAITKTIIAVIGIYVFLDLFIYTGISFYNLSFNSFYWAKETRFLFLIITGLPLCFAPLLFLMIKDFYETNK